MFSFFSKNNSGEVEVEATPNPNARKFIVDKDVISQGKATFSSQEQGAHLPLVSALFALPGVEQVHLFENVVTISKTPDRDWPTLEADAKAAIQRELPNHRPDFAPAPEKKAEYGDPALQKIDEILERTVRPYLQGDGGDLQLVSLEGKVLTIAYQGACGSCPSSSFGTLQAIQETLRAEFDPEIEVTSLDGPSMHPYGFF